MKTRSFIVALIFLLSPFFYSFASEDKGVEFPAHFVFGVSNAPSQVEDQLEDAWAKWIDRGKVPATKPNIRPKERIGFWSRPDIEFDLAKKLGVDVFRLGVDWDRLGNPGNWNKAAILKYKEMLKELKKRDIKTMLTLLHHSLPKWAVAKGGMTKKSVRDAFVAFSLKTLEELHEDIDYLITVNEPHVYCLLTQVEAMWPTHLKKSSALNLFDNPLSKGPFSKCVINMASAHNEIYKEAKKRWPKLRISYSHQVTQYIPLRKRNPLDLFAARMAQRKFTDLFLNYTGRNVDFYGLNYYGSEILKGTKVVFSKGRSYSDAGRAIDPKGLYNLLVQLNKRLNKKGKKKLPFFITENGVSDSSDKIRGSYIIEHLAAIEAAMKKGVPVEGLIHWTLTDNFEWSDGYCPKFGLVSVDRKTSVLSRSPRDSFYTYQKIIKDRGVSASLRKKEWREVQGQIGLDQFLCRAWDGKSGLETPRRFPYKDIDWRFR